MRVAALLVILGWAGAALAQAPIITSFTPSSGPVGTVITITGTNLSGVTTPGWIGSAHDAAITNVSSTSLNMTVPADAPVAADQLALLSAAGDAFSSSNFTVTTGAHPSITSFTPSSGPVGTVITITGTNLSGATTPGWIGSAHDAVVTNVSGTSVRMTVPSDAPVAADQLAVFTAGGNAFSSSNFTVTASGSPTISSFTPSSGPVGTVITVTGTNLSGATQAWVGSAHDATVTNVSSTQMKMTVPSDAPVAADQLAVVTPSGTVWSGTNFTVTSSGGDTQPPTAPSGLGTAVISSSQVNLSWTASTDNVGVTGYFVESCKGASCANFAQIGTPTSTTYSATGLTASTSYSFRVRATDAAGNLSPYSNIATATTSGSGGDTQPPSNPGALTATAGDMQTVLAWSASTDNVGVTGYFIERCQGLSCSSFVQITTVSGTTTTYTDTGIAADTSFSYRVRATDAAGNLSGYSNVASDVPSDCD